MLVLMSISPFFLSAPLSPSPQTADLEHLQDFEHSVKALVQETLWYLNMDKVSVERVEEMREMVRVTESCIKKVILADHSTVVSYKCVRVLISGLR